MATFTGSDKAIAFLFDMVANMADDYDSTATYNFGDYAIYNGTLYKCAYTISTPADFTPTHWQSVLVMDEITSGGGGGGTTVIANPAGVATDTLNKLQVASTIYSVSSGGSGNTYSTTEHAVGTWVDGATIYEKTFVYTINDLHDGQVNTSIMNGNFYTDLTNIDTMWIDYGNSFFKNTYSVLNPKSLSLNFPVGSSYTRCNIQQSTVNSGRPFFYFENTWAANIFYNARNDLTWYITVRYTKTV